MALGMATLRAVGGLVLVALLTWWTIYRLRGGESDPTLRFAKSSETGSSSMLLSGSYAVGAVVLVAGVLLAPWLRANPLALVVLAIVFVAHLVIEGRETE